VLCPLTNKAVRDGGMHARGRLGGVNWSGGWSCQVFVFGLNAGRHDMRAVQPRHAEPVHRQAACRLLHTDSTSEIRGKRSWTRTMQ
jgi:hypothetical protein